MSTSQCGSKKSCYVSLKTCDTDPKTCNFVLSWNYDGELINYELTGLSSVWLALVFSQDNLLGNDNIIVCMRRPGSESSVSVIQYFKNTNDGELVKLVDASDNLINTAGYYNPAGYIYCKFSRPKESSNPLVADLTKPQYIYIERGAPNELIDDKLKQKFLASDNQIEFASTVNQKTSGPVSSRSWLVKVHGK
jgi:hypothetical protein